MKRIDKAIEIETKKIYDRITVGSCPNYVDDKLPDIDEKTLIQGSTGNVIGCNSIACIECWNQELIEDKQNG